MTYQVVDLGGTPITEATHVVAGPASKVPGPPGPSAYEVAVANGFAGSEAEWLASLHGADSTTPGPSAYDAAVSNGFVGTEAEWLASLHGADSTVPGPEGPGLTQPSTADRTPVAQTIPGASPLTWTCPAEWVAQLTVTGGAGISISINAGGGAAAFLGGTGASVILTPGESAVVAWSTTAPTAVRTRRILAI